MNRIYVCIVTYNTLIFQHRKLKKNYEDNSFLKYLPDRDTLDLKFMDTLANTITYIRCWTL